MKITSRIHAIKIPFTIPLAPGRNLERFVYFYIVEGEERTCLIDSGVAGSAAIVVDSLEQLGKSLVDVSLMILTHSHPDHIGGAQALRKGGKFQIGAHPAAREWVEDVDRQCRERPVPGFHSLVGGSVKIDRVLEDMDTVDLGGISLRVIHAPGHSRCSLALFCREEGVLFSGDAIPLGNDLPIYDDAAVAVASIRRLQKTAGVRHLLASWSDPLPDDDPYQIMDNGLRYFQNIHAAVRTLREPETDPMGLCRQMVAKLGLPEAAVNPLVARSFVSHLPYLDQAEL